MVGDASDVAARLKATLPVGWFIEPTPVLDSLLSGISVAWSWCYGQIQFILAQARLATASGFGLDLWANDYFGTELVRNGATDSGFRAQISAKLLRPCGTRSAVANALNSLTGREPAIFEPARPADTGAYSAIDGQPLGLGYGAAGAWGSLVLPFQAFVVAYRPAEAGIPVVGGWGCSAGGYGGGRLEYANLNMVQGQVTDADISATVAALFPAASTAWLRISN